MAELSLAGLRIEAAGHTLVDQVDLSLSSGEIVGLVGPSGAGKTLTSRALVGLVDLEPGVVRADLVIRAGGAIWRPWEGILGADRSAVDQSFAPIRGRVIGWLPQDARGALDPLRRVGWQVRAAAAPGSDEDPIRLLERAGLGEPDRVARMWPHQLSGGMARRVTIAQLLARKSPLAILDEPTSGIDAAGVSRLCGQLRRLAHEQGLGLLVITHDLRILSGLADRLVLIERGRSVEHLPTGDLRQATSALATRLLQSTQRMAARGPA